jgi:hypothetical protein
MGVHKNISRDVFPKQDSGLGRKVKVYYHFDTLYFDEGVIVRDDVESPYVTIILLDNGRLVLSSECQYSW